MELNPKHPTTEKMREQWHKIVVALMLKFKVDKVTLTVHDINNLATCGKANITIKSDLDGLKLELVDDVTALQLSEEK